MTFRIEVETIETILILEKFLHSRSFETNNFPYFLIPRLERDSHHPRNPREFTK